MIRNRMKVKPPADNDGLDITINIHTIVNGDERQLGIEYVPATDPALKGRDVWVTKDPSDVIHCKGD